MTNLPDINVWVALSYERHAHHPAAKDWFDALPANSASFCRVTQMGLLRLLTNPDVLKEDVLTNEQAWGAFRALANDPRVSFSAELLLNELDWFDFTKGRSRHIWTDSYLATFAVSHHLNLVSFDNGFSSFPKLHKTVLSVPAPSTLPPP